MKRLFPFCALGAIILTNACERETAAPAPAPRPTVETRTYQCGDQTVRFHDAAGRASLRVDGEEREIELNAIEAASGAAYAGEDRTEFRIEKERATLKLRGVTLADCIENGAIPDASGGTIFRARGNEPGWLLELGASTFKLTLDYGDKVVAGPTPDPQSMSDGLLYTDAEKDLSIRIFDELCRDASTGMPHPQSVTVRIASKSYEGCGGEPVELLLGEWTVASLDGTLPHPGAKITMRFYDDGVVSGSASCNTYTAQYALSGEGLTISQSASTMMACTDQQLMEQEQRFLDLFAATTTFDFAEDGGLILYTNDRRKIAANR